MDPAAPPQQRPTTTPMPAPSQPASSESLKPEDLRSLSWRSPLTPDGVIDALRSASRRGKLAGFRTLDSPPVQGAPTNPGTRHCACDIFGAPYDRDLFITIEPQPQPESTPPTPTSTLRFDTRLRRRFPIAVIVTMALALWPGVWLTDSLLVTYFAWYPQQTAWVTPAWYIPLTLLAIPVLIKQYKKSEAEAASEAAKVIRKLKRFTNADGVADAQT